MANPWQAASAQANTQMFYNGNSSIDGIGSFASVRIPRGQLIHSERPFLCQHSDEVPISPQGPQDPQWRTWLGLRPPGTPLPEIFRTTSIRCGIKRRGNQQVQLWGVFLQAVRFNSSCQPNVHAHWNVMGGCMEFRALRNIPSDEELCICYDIPTLLYSTWERRRRLRSKFGFNCRCMACSQNSPSSDQRRTQLRVRIEARVPKIPSSAQGASNNHRFGNDQTNHEKLQNIIRQKTSAIVDLRHTGLHHYADTLHYDLYIAQNRAGDTNGATLCLLTARNLMCGMIGKDDCRVGTMTEMLTTYFCDDFAILKSWARTVSVHPLALPAIKGNYSPMTVPSDNDVDGPNDEPKLGTKMKNNTNVSKIQAVDWVGRQEDTDVDTAREPPISLQDDTDTDKADFQAGALTRKREDVDTNEPNARTTSLIQAQGKVQPGRPSPDLGPSALLDSTRTSQGAPFSLHPQSGSSSPPIADPVGSRKIDEAFERIVLSARAARPLRSSSPKAARIKLIKTERGGIQRVQNNSSVGVDLGGGDDVYQENDTIPDLSGRVELCQLRPMFNGQYSAVYQGKIGQHLVAVKVLKEIPGAEAHTMQRKLERERITWGKLQHRNVLPLYGFAKDHELFQPFGAFISPWRPQGNAHQFLEKRGKDLSADQRLDLWKGVVAGVAYLHNHKPLLVHGDLKTANILIDDHHQPQLCDFGLISILLEEGDSGMTTTSQHTGTDRYLAYELLNEQTAVPTTASDIYALGCTGLEFYFSQIPHARHKNNMRSQIFTAIKAGTPPAARTRSCDPQSEAFWDLLDKCWMPRPSDRPKAEQLLAELQLPPFATTWTEKDLSITEHDAGDGLSGSLRMPFATSSDKYYAELVRKWYLPSSQITGPSPELSVLNLGSSNGSKRLSGSSEDSHLLRLAMIIGITTLLISAFWYR